MEYKLFKLNFVSPFHIGEKENFYETTEFVIHSDTLFSAFCHSYLLLYGEDKLKSLLEKFINNSPPFIISSTFPWWDTKIYFPIPLNQISRDKKIKKILFVEKDGFEQILTGRSITEIINNGFATIPDLKKEKDEDKKPYFTINVPRIGLNRITNHPGDRFFHFGEVFYKENSGLFFLVYFKDNTIEKEFNTTLMFMSEEGIGGDRTVGKGLFEIAKKESITINIPENIDSKITLSLYYPKEEEIEDIKDGYYEILERRGYIYSPFTKSLRRKNVRMFKEGSVFNSQKEGKIVDVTPEIFTIHKIYRYGLAFTLPCKLEIENEN